jgi:GMP synthase-like glutamine amidotransferase
MIPRRLALGPIAVRVLDSRARDVHCASDPMRSLHVVQHVSGEGPGLIAEVAATMGIEVIVHRVFGAVPLPEAIASDEGLVVMGGSMGVADLGDPRWPFLAAEVELLKKSLAEGRAVLGVCLGAQLMAHALGAKVAPLMVGDPPARCREVGWGAVTFLAPAQDEPVLAGMDESEVVVHWHGDTFELPEGAVRLASSLVCENQMFRFRNSFAVQFHVEVGEADIAEWVESDGGFVRAANGPGGAQRVLADTRRFATRHRQVGRRLIGNILRAMATSR